MRTIHKVEDYIQAQSLLPNNATIIVGLSGGADSVALLDILINIGYHCVAAHCNFHLRGEESDRDFLFAKRFCAKREIEFVHTDFDTYQYMSDKSISLEMAARELRYNWFEEVRNQYEADKIAVAHHQDDSIETVLINLIRGTGIRGLTGISVQNGAVIRPLLCLSRGEIINYLSERHLDYVVDSTNLEDVYIRNKIRLNIIPLLETINPSVRQAISRTSENLRATENLSQIQVKKIKDRIFANNTVNIDCLLEEDEPRFILFEILNPYGFNFDRIINIFNSLQGQSGKRFYSPDYVLIKDRNTLVLEKIEEKDQQIFTLREDSKQTDFPIRLKIEKDISMDHFLESDKNTGVIFVDNDKIKYPLSVRRWKQGDRFIPFGMKGSKKLSDYFSDRKFSILDKEKIWLLCSDDTIVWIIGERADNRFRITNSTKNITKVSLVE